MLTRGFKGRFKCEKHGETIQGLRSALVRTTEVLMVFHHWVDGVVFFSSPLPLIQRTALDVIGNRHQN
jgi:hypothetical protein